MKKYTVIGTCTIPVYVQVQANSEEEAKEIAQQLDKHDWDMHGEDCCFAPDNIEELCAEIW